jgi:hypothetical protein
MCQEKAVVEENIIGLEEKNLKIFMDEFSIHGCEISWVKVAHRKLDLRYFVGSWGRER